MTTNPTHYTAILSCVHPQCKCMKITLTPRSIPARTLKAALYHMQHEITKKREGMEQTLGGSYAARA